MLKPGLYEQLVNNDIKNELEDYPEYCKKLAQVDEAEAAGIISKYVAEIVKKQLNIIAEKGGSDSILKQIELANKVIESANSEEPGVLLSIGDTVEENGMQLLSLMDKTDKRIILDKKASDIERPQTSLAQSSLFTGAPNEPQMFSELKKEIASADRIDMLVSFIKFSGLRLIIDELRDFTENGGQLRVITTSYMGATDIKAVERLSKLPNTEIKISYDTKITRLHAKTYVFYRNTGYSTAYVGSSNLSNAAMTSGLEWNIKLTAKDQPETIAKIAATFETYWNMPVFETYDSSQYEKLKVALAPVFEGKDTKYWFDVNPYSYQQEILDNLKAEREIRGNYRNLVVAATGTGKTVISALDYRNFRLNNHRSRLLFVAHREEILKQQDDALYKRRNSAIEQERKIKENELNTEIRIAEKEKEIREKEMETQRSIQEMNAEMEKERVQNEIELEEQNKLLVDLMTENERKKSDAKAYDARVLLAVFEEMDPNIVNALAMSGMDSKALIAKAFVEIGDKAEKIGMLNVAPDLLETLAAK